MFGKRLSGLFVAAVVSLSLTVDVQSQEAIREGSLSGAFNTLATQIHAFTTSEKIISGSGKDDVKDLDKIVLRVDDFSVADKFRPSKATKKQLANKLSEALIKRKVKVAKTDVEPATHVLKGECRGIYTSNGANLELIVSLVTSDGVEVNGFRASVNAVEVSDREEVASILGLTVDATTAKPKSSGIKGDEEVAATQANKFKESVKNPTVAITSPEGQKAIQTIVSPTKSSKFKIEILVKTDAGFVPVEVKNVGGMAVVGLKKDDTYQVKIYNDFDFDVAVKLTLDGINSLSLSKVEAYRRAGCWIIPGKSKTSQVTQSKPLTITGWHITDEDVKDFLVTTYPDSVAQSLGGQAEGIGVIQAQFFPAWSGNEPPFEELMAGSRAASDGLATGAGEIKQSRSEKLVRHIGKTLLGAITVRYSRPEIPMDLPTDAPQK